VSIEPEIKYERFVEALCWWGLGPGPPKHLKSGPASARITRLELGSRQNMTDMDTKRASGKCIVNALVCQLC